MSEIGVIHTEYLKRGHVNLIIAPCHSGKTTAAKKIFDENKAMSPRGLLLIDTTAGRDSLLRYQKAQRTPSEIAEMLNPYTNATEAVGDSFVTMTYYEFGIYARYYPAAVDMFDVIICDEIHNLICFLAIEEGRNRQNYPEGYLEELGEGELEYACALDCIL